MIGRMIFQKPLSLNVGVDLRGPDVGVTKHFLHGANISQRHTNGLGMGWPRAPTENREANCSSEWVLPEKGSKLLSRPRRCRRRWMTR